jgi:hypothetical protein
MKILSSALIFILLAAALASGQEDDPAAVRGRVTTLAGDALEGVEVKFFQLDGISGNSPAEKLVKTAKTDKAGNYRVEKLPWGQYRVEFSSDLGKTEIWRFYLWRKADRVLDAGIPVGYTHGLAEIPVAGQVRATDNDKLENATVTLVNAYDPGETQQVRTDKNGRYRMTLIQPGQYIIFVTGPGFEAAAKNLDLGNGAAVNVDFSMKPRVSKPLFAR